MTSATTTTPGSILLAGDLSGTATSPALAPTGVVAGAHFPYKIWVDSKGRLLKSSDLTADTVMPWLNTASDTQVGVVKVATGNWKGLIAASSGTISAPAATSSVFGQVKGDGTTVLNELDGTLSLILPIATTSTKGLMQVGTGLNVTGGVISLDTSSWATTVSKGLVAVGTGLDVASTVISLNAPDATSSSKGIIQVTNGNGLDLTGAVLSKTPYYQDASTTQHGIVQVTQANGLTITGGVLAYTAPPPADATTSTKGVIQVGSGLGVSSGTLSVNVATTSTQGILQVTNGNGLTLTGGTLAYIPGNYLGTITTKGFLTVGSGLSVTSGTVSVDNTALPVATSSVKGIASFSTGLTVTAGVITLNTGALPTATSSVLGLINVPTANGLSISAGSISLGLASTSVFGAVKVGSTLNVASGVIDIPTSYVQNNVANTFTKTVNSSLTTRSSVTGSTDINPTTYGDMQLWNLTGNVTLSNPSSYVAGGIYTIILQQDATGGRTASFGTNFKTGGTITLTSTPNAYDMLQIICVSSTEFLVLFNPDWT